MISLSNKVTNKFLFLLFIVCVVSSVSFADGLGSLFVSSEAQSVKVYLDNIYIGESPVRLDKVQAGDHLVIGKIGDEIIFRKVIRIKPDERSFIKISFPAIKKQMILSEDMASETKVRQVFKEGSASFSPEWASLSERLTLKKEEFTKSEKNPGDKQAEQKVERGEKISEAEEIPDVTVLFKKRTESGLSLYLGCSSTSVSIKTGYSHKSSSGISGAFGYDFNILNLKTRLLIEGAFGNNGYVLPVMADFIFSLGEDSSQYIGLGVGYFFTDLTGNGGIGYRATYGFGSFIEEETFLLEMITDLFANDQASMYKFTLAVGYRWGGGEKLFKIER